MKYSTSLTALTAFTEATLVAKRKSDDVSDSMLSILVVPLSLYLGSGILNYPLTLECRS